MSRVIDPGFLVTVTHRSSFPRDYKTRFTTMKEMSWDEFEAMLIARGWPPEDARRERMAQEYGPLGDCDGDADPWA